MSDKFTVGFTAGVIGGLFQSAVKVLFYVLGVSKLLWLDFISVLTHGEKTEGLIEKVVFGGLMLGWTGTLGVLYIFILPYIGRGQRGLKGIWFGLLIWFATYASISLFQVPELSRISVETVYTDLIAGAIWGITLAEAVHILEKKGLHSSSLRC